MKGRVTGTYTNTYTQAHMEKAGSSFIPVVPSINKQGWAMPKLGAKNFHMSLPHRWQENCASSAAHQKAVTGN